ncbi:restriction endonuclease subunit S [Streptomyces xanthophaeus]
MSRTVPLKRLARIRYGLGQPPPAAASGVPILRATNISRGKISSANLIYSQLVNLPLDRAPLLDEGEILVVRSGAYTGDSARVSQEWAGSAPGYDLRVTPEFADSRYLAYTLLGSAALDQMVLASTRAAQPHLNAEELGEVHVWEPSLEEQRRIADFLDAETARIDVISAQRKYQLSLFEERGVSLVLHTVSGRDVSSNRKHSGLDWLGDIPDTWAVMPVSHQYEVLLGKMLNPERSRGEHLRSYLRNVNVQWDHVDTDDLLEMNFPPHERQRYRLRSGDLLICEGGEPGRCAVWDGAVREIYYQKALHRVRPRGYSSARWLFYCMKAATSQNVFAVEGNSTTIAHLTGEQLRAHRFPFPPREVQDLLVRKLDEWEQESRLLRSRIDRQLALLAERRQSLITAAVTGQLDVTTAGRAAVV